MLTTIGDIINRARKDKGLTVAELSARAGVIEATLKNIIGNRISIPRRENLEPLCEVLELDMDEVVKATPGESDGQLNLNAIVRQYEYHIQDITESYEKRLSDKREVIEQLEKHIETIVKDKRWFRIGFIVMLSLLVFFLVGFVILEILHPQHGWIQW